MAAKLKWLAWPLISFIILCQSAPPASADGNLAGNVQVVADGDYFPALLDLIGKAKSNIDLAMFLFKTSGREKGKNRPDKVRDALIHSAERGVKVRVYLEFSGHDQKLNAANKRVAKELREAGITVIFDSPQKTSHIKMVVVDHRYSLVGSHNLTHAALKYNHELSLLLDDPGLAAKLISYMEDNIQP